MTSSSFGGFWGLWGPWGTTTTQLHNSKIIAKSSVEVKESITDENMQITST